jgi:uncharacterized protein YhfF
MGSHVSAIPHHIKAFWQHFLASQPDPLAARERFYEAFQIGTGPEDADEGVRLIRCGQKTATSSLLWDYEARGKSLPQLGSLSVLEDGRKQAVCVVETSWLEVLAFDRVDAEFARDYGEADGTLEGWRSLCWPYYAAACVSLGRTMSRSTPLVCERFRVVFD